MEYKTQLVLARLCESTNTAILTSVLIQYTSMTEYTFQHFKRQNSITGVYLVHVSTLF